MSHEPNERTADDIRREITRTRTELAETVAALAEKTDVKAQVKGRVEEVKSDVREKAEAVKEKVVPNRNSGDGAAPYEGPSGPLAAVDPLATNRDLVVGVAAAVAVGVAVLWLIRRR
jgi:hypothetical protein